MTLSNRRQFFLYSSLFITLALNLPKLLALRKGGILAHFWHFDGWELCFHSLLTFVYCLIIFAYNGKRAAVFFGKGPVQPKLRIILVNGIIMTVLTLAGASVQRLYFQAGLFPFGGYGFRFTVSLVLIALELRIWLLLQQSQEKEIENEHLRSANLQSELALLKGQLNPHFLFNSLSSLSATVREDPRRAQHYIAHLSKVFRYTLELSHADLIPLKDELQQLRSYAELLKMRYEDGFCLTLPPADTINGDALIPPMSLQLLVENALRHNRASVAEPLKVVISRNDQTLEVQNNLQPLSTPEPGAGIGLPNLNQRFKLLLRQEIVVMRTDSAFIVKLPLQ